MSHASMRPKILLFGNSARAKSVISGFFQAPKRAVRLTIRYLMDFQFLTFYFHS